MLIVLSMVGATLYLFLFTGHWRRGTGLMAVTMLAGGVLRFVLPADRVGMLSVRGKWRDTLCYLVLGGVILGVAIRLH